MSFFAKIENDWLAAPDTTPIKVSYCCVCSEAICEGDSYWDTNGGAMCCECAETITAAVFLQDVCFEKENTAIKD